MDDDLELRLPPRPEFVRVARHVVGWLGRMREAPDAVIDDVRLVASEAVTKAVVANGEAGSDDPIVLRAVESDGTFTLEILDRAAELPSADVSFEVDTGEMSFEHGTWLAVIQGLADEYSVEPREGGGSVVRVTVSA